MTGLYEDFVCAKTFFDMIIATLGQHKDINYNLGGNLIEYYKNLDEPNYKKVEYFIKQYLCCAPNHKSTKEFLNNSINFKPVWNHYRSLKPAEVLNIKEYISFTRMNFTPSDKFLCDCCTMYDGTSILQLNIITYILNHSKNVHLSELDDWKYECVADVNKLYEIKYSPVWLYRDTIYDDIDKQYKVYTKLIKKNNIKASETFKRSLFELIKFKEFFGCIEKRFCPYKFLAKIPKGIADEHTYLNFEDNYAPHINAICKIIAKKGTVGCNECSKHLEKEYFKDKRLKPFKYPESDVFRDYVKLIYKCYEI